jgi:hypothetical protein
LIFKPEASSSGIGVGGVGVLGGAGIGRLEAIAAAAGYLPETQDMYYQPSIQFVDSRTAALGTSRFTRGWLAVIFEDTPGRIVGLPFPCKKN